MCFKACYPTSSSNLQPNPFFIFIFNFLETRPTYCSFCGVNESPSSVNRLDIESGIVEVRQMPNIWEQRLGNWMVDYNNRSAMKPQTRLIDNRGRLFKQVAGIFFKFEFERNLTVYQPDNGSLSVELQRL